MGFSRQEYWSGLPFPSPRDVPDPAIEPGSLTAGRRLPSEPQDEGKARVSNPISLSLEGREGMTSAARVSPPRLQNLLERPVVPALLWVALSSWSRWCQLLPIMLALGEGMAFLCCSSQVFNFP